jgi:hypothetical protein
MTIAAKIIAVLGVVFGVLGTILVDRGTGAGIGLYEPDNGCRPAGEKQRAHPQTAPRFSFYRARLPAPGRQRLVQLIRSLCAERSWIEVFSPDPAKTFVLRDRRDLNFACHCFCSSCQELIVVYRCSH